MRNTSKSTPALSICLPLLYCVSATRGNHQTHGRRRERIQAFGTEVQLLALGASRGINLASLILSSVNCECVPDLSSWNYINSSSLEPRERPRIVLKNCLQHQQHYRHQTAEHQDRQQLDPARQSGTVLTHSPHPPHLHACTNTHTPLNPPHHHHQKCPNPSSASSPPAKQ